MVIRSNLTQLFHLDQAAQEWLAVFALAVVKQLVNEALASTAAMNEQVFELFQAREVQPQLCVAPAGELANMRGVRSDDRSAR